MTPLMITAVCHLKPQVWTPRWKVQNSHLVKCSNKASTPDIKAYSTALGVGVVEVVSLTRLRMMTMMMMRTGVGR